MILKTEPLSIPEAISILQKSKTENPDLIGFVNKIPLIKLNKAKEIKKELQSLDIIKMNPEHLVKIIDLMPETAEELNKIFIDVSLDENESKKLLETIKKYK